MQLIDNLYCQVFRVYSIDSLSPLRRTHRAGLPKSFASLTCPSFNTQIRRRFWGNRFPIVRSLLAFVAVKLDLLAEITHPIIENSRSDAADDDLIEKINVEKSTSRVSKIAEFLLFQKIRGSLLFSC